MLWISECSCWHCDIVHVILHDVVPSEKLPYEVPSQARPGKILFIQLFSAGNSFPYVLTLIFCLSDTENLMLWTWNCFSTTNCFGELDSTEKINYISHRLFLCIECLLSCAVFSWWFLIIFSPVLICLLWLLMRMHSQTKFLFLSAQRHTGTLMYHIAPFSLNILIAVVETSGEQTETPIIKP